jgi:hypothetical protein
MKMKTLKLLFFICVLSPLFMLNCSTEDNELNDLNSKNNEVVILNSDNLESFMFDVRENFNSNEKLVKDFIKKSRNNQLEKADYLNMLNIMQISKNIDVSYLETKEAELHFPDYYAKGGASGSWVTCDDLVEIRNAMLDECDRYVFGLDEICSASVMMAYWIRSSENGC